MTYHFFYRKLGRLTSHIYNDYYDYYSRKSKKNNYLKNCLNDLTKVKQCEYADGNLSIKFISFGYLDMQQKILKNLKLTNLPQEPTDFQVCRVYQQVLHL